MNAILVEARTSVVATLVLALLLCGAYPVAVWGLAQALFPSAANGSLVGKDGGTTGSRLIGQNFSSPGYFHSRPSAAGKGYDATSSGGTNLGPISQKLLDAVKARVEGYRRENALGADVLVPADAVTASASGLDPHISPANAALQLPRVARERGLPVKALQELVAAHTEAPDLGFLGEARVNVLMLNLALDDIGGSAKK
jgi:potassium-transporting ATPase KdpC subunit